jgi:branched-chain amino acid transport system permease protein
MMINLVVYAAFFLTVALSYGIICLGLNLQWGQTGLFNVGISGFVAIGAYASALLTTPDAPGRLGGFGMPFFVGWLAGAALAGLVSLLTGVVALRLRADYLAITTFGIATAIHLVALNAESLTGGPFGIGFIPRPFSGFETRPLIFNAANLLLLAGITVIVFIGLERLVRSPWGRVLRSIREDETAAVSLGKNANYFRLQAFGLGGAFMGLGGAIQAHFIGFIAPDNYLPILTFQVWAMLIIGGSGNNRGAILGSVFVWALWSASGAMISELVSPEHQARAAALQIVMIGIVLAAILVLRPRGILGEALIVSRFLRKSHIAEKNS